MRWEYHQSAVPVQQLLAECSAHGAEGWELAMPPFLTAVQMPDTVGMSERGVLVKKVDGGQVPGFLLLFRRELAEGGEGTKPANGRKSSILLPG